MPLFNSTSYNCPSIVSCTNNSAILKITKLYKTVICIIECNFKQLKILLYKKFIQQTNLKMMHSITHNYAPSPFSKIWPRNTDENIEYNPRNINVYIVPNSHIELLKNSSLYSFSKLRDDVNEVKLQQNKIKTFQINVMDYLLNGI